MRLKHTLFALLPFILFLLATEFVVRTVYFQYYSGSFSGLNLLYDWTAKYYAKNLSPQVKLANAQTYMLLNYQDLFYGKEGAPLMRELQEKYKSDFRELLQEATKAHAKVLYLYIPSVSHHMEPETTSFRYHAFFQSVAKETGVEFLDVSDVLARYPMNQVTLMPEDTHLSRFGHQLVAKALQERLQKWKNYRSDAQYSERERGHLFGDLKPNIRSVWDMNEAIPYVAGSNSQGLRNSFNFTFPKSKQRILCLGDSFTFGLKVPEVHTFTHFLATWTGLEVANAGVHGYTIEDELDQFQKRSKYLEPDIIVIQAYDNDLMDELYDHRLIFNRRRERIAMTATEKEFFEYLKQLPVRPAKH